MAKQNSPRIFVSLAAPTLSAMEALAVHVAGVPVGYELRLDYLQDFSQFESQLHQMLAASAFSPDHRHLSNGGGGGQVSGHAGRSGGNSFAAVRAGCQWVDVEIESLQKGSAALC